MARLGIYIKTELKTQLKQAHIVLGLYLLLPLFFSLLMSFSYSPAFVPEVESDPIQVSILNKDEGETGQLFEEALAAEGMNPLIEIVDAEESAFHLYIQPGYSENLTDTLVTIEAKNNSSSSEENILTQITTEWQKSLVNQQTIAAELGEIEDEQAKNNVLVSLEESLQLNASALFETQDYESATALTSNQFTAVSGLLYIFFMSLSSSVNMQSQKLKGFHKRFEVAPLSPAKKVIYEVITNTILFSGISLLYIGIWWLIDPETFIGNPLFYLVWVIIYAFFFQVLNAMFMFILPAKLTQFLYLFLLVCFMVFGFLPLDRMMSGEIGEFFNQNIFRQLFNQPIYDFMITQDFTANWLVAMLLVIASLIIAVVTIKIKSRKELSRV